MARESLEIAFIFEIVHSMHKYINKIYLNIKFQVMLEANQISFVLNCVADQSNKWTFWGTLNREWKIYHFKQKPQTDNGMFGKSIRPKSLLYVDDNQTLQRKESIESIVEFLNSHSKISWNGSYEIEIPTLATKFKTKIKQIHCGKTVCCRCTCALYDRKT